MHCIIFKVLRVSLLMEGFGVFCMLFWRILSELPAFLGWSEIRALSMPLRVPNSS